MSDIQARGKTVQRVASEVAKWIDWPEFLNCMKQLKAECTPIGKSNQQRSKSDRYINSGASVEVMESLAELMGHSPQMQHKIYSRHAQTQHSTLALDTLAAILTKVWNEGSLLSK